MRINTLLYCKHRALKRGQAGVTLLETIVFIVVMSIAMSSIFGVFNHHVAQSVDPVVRVQALEQAQSLLAEIMARKFDESTPSGGVPACGSSTAPVCLGITADTDYDDVGDYNGFTQTFEGRYSLSVAVKEAGLDLGLPAAQARRVEVTVSMPGAGALVLSTYKVNF